MTDHPLSRLIAVSTIPAEGLTVDVVATDAERAALAAANEVESVESFVAKLDVRPFGRDGVAVRGALEADTTRLCVVTLETFPEHVEEDVYLRLAPGGAADPEDDDSPDPLVGDQVDVGAILSEFFTVGLDPYPRKPGVEFSAPETPAGSESPFAALKALAKPDGKRG